MAFLTTQGLVQVSLMFVFGAAVFSGSNSPSIGTVFFAMYFGHGIVRVAAWPCSWRRACRTRSQMNWVSVVVILRCQRFGGKHGPTLFGCPSRCKTSVGLRSMLGHLKATKKFFWSDLPVIELWKELAILTACGCRVPGRSTLSDGTWIQE